MYGKYADMYVRKMIGNGEAQVSSSRLAIATKLKWPILSAVIRRSPGE